MKKILTFVLISMVAAAFGGTQSFRIDVKSVADKVKLLPQRSKSMTYAVSPSYVVEAERPYTIIVTSKREFKDPEKWSKVTFTLLPKSDGEVVFEFGGEWAQDPMDRQWFYIGGLSVNDKNIDFSKCTEDDPLPEGLELMNKSTLELNAGPDEKASAFYVNHDSRLRYRMKAAADQPIKISLDIKPEDPEE